ncbi:unnamed protein product, partial [Pylaiella littoralis]
FFPCLDWGGVTLMRAALGSPSPHMHHDQPQTHTSSSHPRTYLPSSTTMFQSPHALGRASSNTRSSSRGGPSTSSSSSGRRFTERYSSGKGKGKSKKKAGRHNRDENTHPTEPTTI